MLTFSRNIIVLSNYIFRLFAAIFLLITMPANAQNNSTVTFNGIGEIKLGMKKTDLEILLNKTIPVPNITSNKFDVYQDTVHLTYSGIEEYIILQRPPYDENQIIVWEIRSKSGSIKTKSGIGIGDNMAKIIFMYEDYMLYIIPTFDTSNDKIRIQGKSTIELYSSDRANKIIFYLNDDEVTEVGLKFEHNAD
jgi:hypothetical protein